MQYFVILTLQHGSSTYSAHCTVDANPGVTRQHVLTDVRAQVPAPFNTNGTVLFFSCEPNRLGGA